MSYLLHLSIRVLPGLMPASETQFLGIPSFHPLAIIINYHRVVIYGYDPKIFFVRILFCYQYHFCYVVNIFISLVNIISYYVPFILPFCIAVSFIFCTLTSYSSGSAFGTQNDETNGSPCFCLQYECH
jgi:hypothetical protein